MPDIPWVVELPEPVVEGATITYSVLWQGAAALSSPTAYVYLNETDITSTVMPSGSHSVSGNIQTLKPIAFQDGDGGNYYVVVAECVVDGNTDRVKFKIKVLRKGEE